MNIFKRFLLAGLLSFAMLPLMAQDVMDEAYVFIFEPGSGYFEERLLGNGDELDRLLSDLSQLRNKIISGQVVIRVDSWSAGADGWEKNLELAQSRATRIKSEIIVFYEFSERHFLTKSHAGGDNFVSVRFVEADGQTRPVVGLEGDVMQLRSEMERLQSVLSQSGGQNERHSAGHSDGQSASRQTQSRQVSQPHRRSSHDSFLLPGFYLGAQASVPYVESAYSSQATGKVFPGWSAGLYFGYRFSSYLSLEAQASWIQSVMGARNCCPDYWIGADGVIYQASVAFASGWNWHDLRSEISMQRYGVQLNVNLLGFSPQTAAGRWSLELSPKVALYNSKPELVLVRTGETVMRAGSQWSLGAGGNIQVNCSIVPDFTIGLFGGFTYLFGDHIDGTAEHRHEQNHILETGLRLGWNFGQEVRR